MGAQFDLISGILLGTMLAINLYAFGFFYLVNKKADQKRKMAPLCIIVTYMLFVLLVWRIEAPKGMELQAFLVLAAVVAPLALLNLSSIRFCSVCGKPWFRHHYLRAPKNCWWCEASLEK